MPKQLVEIDVPEGWEAIEGEILPLSSLQNDKQLHATYRVHFRKAWQWPQWLKARRIYPCLNGWYATNSIVRKVGNDWLLTTSIRTYPLAGGAFDFTPPPERRVYENPNWKGE